MANFCTNCGSKLNEGSNVCPTCNHAVNGTSNGNTAYPPYGNAPYGYTPNENVFSKVTQKINSLAGGTGPVELKLGDLISNVFKKHSSEEAAEIFACGSKNSTPKDEEISSSWPKPWLYSRVFFMFSITLVLLIFLYYQFGNIIGLQGIIFIGAIIVPFSLLIFFAEVNAPRNISFYEILKIFFIGGCFSLVLTMMFNEAFAETSDKYVSAIITGIVEELAKAVIVIFFISRKPNIKYALNGLLIGAAVGAGFATFESAGYILMYGIQYGDSAMMNTLFLRALLAPGGHVAWAAIYGMAFMLVKKNMRYNSNMLFESKFLTFFLITVAMHAVWDMPIEFGSSIYLIQDILVVAAWVVILVLIQVGLKQISHNDFNNPQYQNPYQYPPQNPPYNPSQYNA